MKPALFIWTLITGVIFSGCSDETSSDNVKATLPGTYIRTSVHEYGCEFDTLVVTLQNEASNGFTLNRRWRYERVLDGKAIEPEYKKSTTSAVYDEAAKQLKETETGDTYSFDSAGGTLFAGKTKYEKLK